MMTNADKIRVMGNEELADFLQAVSLGIRPTDWEEWLEQEVDVMMYDKLVKQLRKCAAGSDSCKTCELYSNPSCCDYLMKQAANAIEELSKKIKTGKWIPFEQYGKTTAHYCSSCENPVKIRTFFCPYCGADMRAEDGE